MRFNINKDWLVGFTDGEGCFSLQKAGSLGQYRQPVFIIGCIDKEILEDIQEFLGCGRIYELHHQGPKKIGTCFHYRVYKQEDIMTKVIPFFDGKLTIKEKQFDNWARQSIMIIEKSRERKSKRRRKRNLTQKNLNITS